MTSGFTKSESETLAYSAPLYTEFYDLWLPVIFGTAHEDDEKWLIELFKHKLSSSKSKTFRFIDLGTGTGRILQYLTPIAESFHASHGIKTTFVGIDIAQAMVDRAAELFAAQFPNLSKSAVEHEWLCASASEPFLGLTPSLEAGTIDIILFSAGGVSHLARPSELDTLFGQLSRLLKPDGIALLSVLHDVIKAKPGEMPATAEHGVEDQIAGTVRLKATSSNNWFVKSPMVTTWEDDNKVRTDTFTLNLVPEGPDGKPLEDEIIWSKELGWKGRLLNHKEWELLISKNGLMMEKEEAGIIQMWFTLRKA